MASTRLRSSKIASNGAHEVSRIKGSDIADAKDIDPSSPFRGAVRISPEWASVWLDINIGNRRKRTLFVQFLSQMIKNGEWQEDHPQPIVFSDAGRLIDGQHRLFAIVESGCTVVANVVCGARDDLRAYMDTGISRKLEDRVTFSEDHQENRHICSIVQGLSWLPLIGKATTSFRITPEEAQGVYAAHRDGILFAAAHMKRNAKGLCRLSVCVALVLMHEKDMRKAEDFAESLLSPDGPIQPARMLRDKIHRDGTGGSGSAIARVVYMWCVHCMKSFLEDKEVKVVRQADW